MAGQSEAKQEKAALVETYVAELAADLKTGHAREHAYRPAFKTLVESLDPSVRAVNDPKQSAHGAPDFAFVRGDAIAGYAETKDLGADLEKTQHSEQLKRYFGYHNLVLTNYLDFHFFRNGEPWGEPISLGSASGANAKTLSLDPNRFAELADTLADFLRGKPEPIRNGALLAKIMAGKARRIRDSVRRFLSAASEKNAELLNVYESMKELLVHDLSPDDFADMYAQTLTYGLFAARYRDESPENFTLREARDLVPKSNPLLRQFFNHIVVEDNFDRHLAYIVGELCEAFALADVRELMRHYFKTDIFGETHDGPDPVVHFYEDFLREYDPGLRKRLGAFYTPLPVVRFIARAVDATLEKDFGLRGGLADAAKTAAGAHRVQILDPAAGTGTFLGEVVRRVYTRFDTEQKGGWAKYVHDDLLPRLHGFELMMTPYTIAHIKLEMFFAETGFTIFNRRLGVYLTNALEASIPRDDTLFGAGYGLAGAITKESEEAAAVKNALPIMVVLGNPPYSVSSNNPSTIQDEHGKPTKTWIGELVDDYKRGLNEKRIHIDDDYIKFIRYAEHHIEKTGSGIVAMITNNSFLDGITHRKMREHLLDTFDDIYILNLHGSLAKKETAPDGGKDENVFDIRQGVAISIFVKKP